MGSSKIYSLTNLLVNANLVALDSMIFLYHFANHEKYANFTECIFHLMETNKIACVTSMVTVTEILIRAEEAHDEATIMDYVHLLQTAPNLEIIPVDWMLSRIAAKLRGQHKYIRLPDALQLSAGLLRNAPLFVTNDNRLKKVKELNVIVLDDFI